MHVVQKEDTLWRIAQQYRVTISQIVQANLLPNPDQLAVGQALVIPTPARVHVVQWGETLWMIAQRYNTTAAAIVNENRITNPNLIYPGQTLRIPKPVIEVNGYLTQIGAVGQQVAREIGEHLTYLTPFSYTMQPTGELNVLNDHRVLQVAAEERVVPLLVLTNFVSRKFSPELAHTVLSNRTVQDKLLTNLINTMRERGYRGLNIDFEYVLPEDRELYNQFLRRAKERLQPAGFSLSTALAPKIKAEQIGLLYEAHDYPAHGEIVDFTVLMTYEWGWAGGKPWAIAPVNEVKRVLDYAVTAIPRHKILMGVPTYGRDWKLPYVQGETIAETISPQEAIRRAIKYGADIQYHVTYQAPYYRYFAENRIEHEVWFEDARSIQAKYNLVKEYGLRGVSYWEITSSFPQNWSVLEDNFTVRKLV